MFPLIPYTLILFFGYNVVVCDNIDLKLDYYEALIKKGILDSRSYTGRADNSDFFKNQTDVNETDFGIFDFIIIGAGSSGSVVANRLSENPKWKILVLEAGGEEDDLSEIPGLHILLENSDKNWGYATTPQKNGCYGMIDRKCPYPRGKVIGGSGAINGVVYFRGAKEDFDKWEKWGNPGWSYQNLSYYFKKLENSQIPDGDAGYHGFAGPINNAYMKPDSPLIDAFIAANEKLGAPYIDLNGKNDEGVAKCQNTVLFGRRVSGGNSYIKSASKRMNLNITTGALVSKILIDKTKTAYGVIFIKNGLKYRAFSRKEVILSGGAINSPQLLMLSGIGPSGDLQKHGIEVVQDLPVGRNLRDHIGFTNVYFRTNFTKPTIPLRQQIKDYFNGVGTLTSSFGSKAIRLRNVNNSRIELVMVASLQKSSDVQAPKYYNKEALEANEAFNTTTDFFISAFLMNPKSGGKITLKSANPRDFPEIDIDIFSCEEDLESMYEAINYAHTLAGTEPFQKYNATPYFKLKPCDKYGYGTKKFWFCALKYLAANDYHMSSTVKMAPRSDPQAVVDSSLRVYGIKNLRVVDCSIMPDTINGHTNIIAFAIGEKASDIIKNCYRY